MSKRIDEMSASELRTQCEAWLRPCATCGHASIDHRHHSSERTHCAVDMGGEKSEPCACNTYEVRS
jgi:hypothetical protein